MTKETAKQIIVLVLKRTGKKEISESDFYLTLSMQLKWCPPQEAKQFMQRAKQDHLIKINQDIIKPTFTFSEVSIPLGFKPSSDFFKQYTPQKASPHTENKKDLFSLISEKTSKSIQEIHSNIKTIENEKLVTEQTALLLYAKHYTIDITPFIDPIEQSLFT